MTTLPWLRDASLFASGSGALVALVRWGARQQGWRRVWLPSYYCPEVPAALRADAAADVELRFYPDYALWAPPSLGGVALDPGDVVVIANQLGVRVRPQADGGPVGRAVIIEDHSHDLRSGWARTSRADFGFASLRKTLPIPDGGAVWSPRGLELPPEQAEASDGRTRPLARLERALARQQERAVADGDGPLRFRALARSSARPLAPGLRGGISPISRALLPHMPVDAWRDRRRRHLEILGRDVDLPHGARVLAAPDGGVAFAFTLLFATAEDRDQAQRVLTERAVIPAVLWPLDQSRNLGTGAADVDLSRRILSVHCDQRYNEPDVRRLAAIVRDALRAHRPARQRRGVSP